MFAIITVASQSCAPLQAVSQTPDDATGICFRRLVASEAGQHHVRLETVIVRQSSSAVADLNRVAEMEYSWPEKPFASHVIPGRWFSAWLSEASHDFTQGPSCAQLPVFLDRQ